MRIKNIFTENYLGILEGTNRSELYIDFEPAYQAGLSRILYFGRNGSGKSTHQKALTPFVSQGDGRQIIVPGRAGRKIVTFARGEREIKCDIRWSSAGKVSAFVFLDGHDQPTELTAKGNQGEYNTEVLNLLGVTPDYLKIGRVGGMVDGFIDLEPGQRKNFIGRFMPEVEEWSAMHKNVAKRITLLKNNMKGMQVELDRIEDRSQLEHTLNRLEAETTRLRSEATRIDTALGSAQSLLSEANGTRSAILSGSGLDASASEFNPLTDQISQKQAAIGRASTSLARMLEARPKLAPYSDLTVANAKVDELSTRIASMNGSLGELRNQRSSLRSALDTAIRASEEAVRKHRQATTSATSLENLRSQATAKEAELDGLREAATDLPNLPVDLKYEDVRSASDSLMSLNSELLDLRNAFPNAALMEEAVENDMTTDFLASRAARVVDQIRETKERLTIARTRVASIEAQASMYKRFGNMHCNDPKCPFERIVGQNSTASAELAEKHNEITALETRIEELEAEKSDIVSTRSAIQTVTSCYQRIRRMRPVLEAAGMWEEVRTSGNFFTLVTSTTTHIAETLNVNKLLDNVSLARNLSEAERVLETLHERITGLEAMQLAVGQLAEMVESTAEAVVAARAEVERVETQITATENSSSALEQALTLIRQLIDFQNVIVTGTEEVSRLTAVSEQLDGLYERYNMAQTNYDSLTAERTEVGNQILSAEAGVNTARLSLSRRDEFEARLADLDGTLSRAQIIADGCHPARGAPVEFLRDFLESTKENVNSLLDIALRGEFRIGFELNEKEFNIPVSRGSGRTIPDITEASDGQIALAKTILSLALVKQTVQSLGGYNIICFDEIDGPLDRERNRERFAEIVDRLSIELGIEQLFMISHNDNFSAAPAGIVLFPGHAMPVTDETFTSNKLILADFS